MGWCDIPPCRAVSPEPVNAQPGLGVRPNPGAALAWKRLRAVGLTWVLLQSFWLPWAFGPVGFEGIPVRLDPEWAVGAWIWDRTALDKQTVRLWRAFEIPAGAVVARAQLRITADNGFRLFVNGREIGRGSDWRSVTEYDLTYLLRPGRHVLAVEGFNDRLEGGVLLGLVVDMMDGQRLEIPSDGSWRIVPEKVRRWERVRHARDHWTNAVVVGAFGAAPWTTKPLAVTRLPPLRPVELRFWQQAWFQFVLISVSAIAGVVAVRLAAQLAVRRRAEALLQRERARIARDIHDEVGAGMTHLVLQGELLQTELPPESAVRCQAAQVCEQARSVARALEEVVWMVNSRRDTLRDFVSFVCRYAQGFLRDTPIRCRLDVQADLPEREFELSQRRGLLLAVKEALNNAAKHSAATELHLRIRVAPDRVRVEVDDNGRGFDPATVSRGNGLDNLQQRLAELGGRCKIRSAPGQGCHVELEAPFRPARTDATGGWWPVRRRPSVPSSAASRAET